MNITNTKSKNLIIGVAANYSLEQLKPFLYSLKQTGYQGDICFLVADLEVSTLEAIKQFGVHAVPLIKPWLRKPLADLVDISTIFSPKERRTQIKLFSAASSLPIHDSRFLYYYLYLIECGKLYSNIMLTDVRDVVFQRDPFDFEIGNQLCFFLEEQKIKDCPCDSEWILKTFGKSALKEISDKQVSCAGVTIGSYKAIMLYLEMMSNYMIQSRGRIARLFGSDQAIHNVILYRGLMKDIQVFRNRYAPVMTMGTMEESQIYLNDKGYLINEDGSIANVLHQYDRHAKLCSELLVRYTSTDTDTK